MSEYIIHRVDRERAQTIEQLGSKPKFWYRDNKRRMLFKADDRGTGEDWAEVITSNLCILLGLPHVSYDLAAEYRDGKFVLPGVICENMTVEGEELVLGNELLLARDSRYPAEQRFRVKQHTVDVVFGIISSLQPPAPNWMPWAPAGIRSAVDVFTGYLLLDAWIANQDRHHENWGALICDTARLAPTFDHGAALARNLTDKEREERLNTKDRNRTIAAFARRGRSAFYRTLDDARPMGLLDAFAHFAKEVPRAGQAWLDRLQSVDPDQVRAIIERVPLERMSDVSKRFTMELLETNRQRLREFAGS